MIRPTRDECKAQGLPPGWIFKASPLIFIAGLTQILNIAMELIQPVGVDLCGTRIQSSMFADDLAIKRDSTHCFTLHRAKLTCIRTRTKRSTSARILLTCLKTLSLKHARLQNMNAQTANDASSVCNHYRRTTNSAPVQSYARSRSRNTTYKKLSGREGHPQKGNTRYGGWAKTLLKIPGYTPLSWIASEASANIFGQTSSNKMLISETQAKHGALYVVGKHNLKTSSKHTTLHITTLCTAKIQ